MRLTMSTGMAKPMPANVPLRVAMAVFMPTTWP